MVMQQPSVFLVPSLCSLAASRPPAAPPPGAPRPPLSPPDPQMCVLFPFRASLSVPATCVPPPRMLWPPPLPPRGLAAPVLRPHLLHHPLPSCPWRPRPPPLPLSAPQRPPRLLGLPTGLPRRLSTSASNVPPPIWRPLSAPRVLPVLLPPPLASRLPWSKTPPPRTCLSRSGARTPGCLPALPPLVLISAQSPPHLHLRPLSAPRFLLKCPSSQPQLA